MYQFIILLFTAVLVALDQCTKYAAVTYLSSGTPVSVWSGVLELRYSENRGIAWGMLQDRQTFVIVLTALMLTFVLVVLMSGRFKGSLLFSVGGAMVLAGGVGNLIDRAVNSYVVDFIHYCKWFDFPIFNVADCCVTIGAVLILVYFFFFGNKEKTKEELADGAATVEPDDGTDGSAS